MAQGIRKRTSRKNLIILINVFIEMDVVKSHHADVKNNYEGTTQKPFFVNKISGKCGSGMPVIVEINDNYYEAHRYSVAKKWTLYRCKEGNNTKAGCPRCPWKCRIKKRKNLDDEIVFEVIDNPNAKPHCCVPIDPLEIEGGHIYRSFVKNAMKQGSRVYSDIKMTSNIKARYKNYTSDITGDESVYHRAMNRVVCKANTDEGTGGMALTSG